MALKVTNYIMTHSVMVSTMPIISENQNHVPDEAMVNAISSDKPIFAVAGFPIPL